MARCDVHCPGGGGVALTAVVALGAGVFAVAEFAVEYAVILVPGVVVMAAVVYGLQRLLLRRTLLVHATLRPRQGTARAVPARAVGARTAPLAIESPAVYLITDVQQSSLKERQ